jgi:hypothetical protein
MNSGTQGLVECHCEVLLGMPRPQGISKFVVVCSPSHFCEMPSRRLLESGKPLRSKFSRRPGASSRPLCETKTTGAFHFVTVSECPRLRNTERFFWRCTNVSWVPYKHSHPGRGSNHPPIHRVASRAESSSRACSQACGNDCPRVSKSQANRIHCQKLRVRMSAVV